ncbi:hypothetical protein EVAR_3838_1 [Eumeta japonica]|uniref:Uncharacterized protein n=1 Tax=Eumeta variegata TaxID=151549 RepID=A0A4C1SR33_EUMVA|nr:hypothetical protein EVAR_3838_1 [Eumeta japonica]
MEEGGPPQNSLAGRNSMEENFYFASVYSEFSEVKPHAIARFTTYVKMMKSAYFTQITYPVVKVGSKDYTNVLLQDGTPKTVLRLSSSWCTPVNELGLCGEGPSRPWTARVHSHATRYVRI